MIFVTGYSVEYILDRLSLDQTIMLYNYSFSYEDIKATILVNKIAEAFFGAKGKSKKQDKTGSKPDLKKFYKLYGNIIKTPQKAKNK